MQPYRRELVEGLIKTGCFKTGTFTLKSGVTSNVYIDLRQLPCHSTNEQMTVYAKIIDALGELYNRLPSVIETDDDLQPSIAGVPYSGIPYAVVLQHEHNVPLVMIRKEKKEHGNSNQIDGPIDKSVPVVLVEDVMTTGFSILENALLLRSEGYTVQDVLVIVDRSTPATLVIQPDHGLAIHSLMKLSDFSIEKRLYSIFESKRNNVILSVDTDSWSTVINVAKKLGPMICGLKIHGDLLLSSGSGSSYSSSYTRACQNDELNKLACTHNFIIIDDRKFADTGRTTELQLKTVMDCVNVVTVHGLPGVDFDVYRRAHKQVLLVAEMSTANNLFTSDYSQSIVELARANPDVVLGIVSQHRLCDLIHFAPGIHRSVTHDTSNQTWSTPEAMDDMDFLIVGRDITGAEDPVAALKTYLH